MHIAGSLVTRCLGTRQLYIAGDVFRSGPSSGHNSMALATALHPDTPRQNFCLQKPSTWPNLALFPGLLTPAFVACSTNAYCKRQTLGGVRRPGNKARPNHAWTNYYVNFFYLHCPFSLCFYNTIAIHST